MPKKGDNEQGGLSSPSYAETLAWGLCLAAGLASLTTVVTAYGSGKRHYGWNAVLGFLLLVGWIAFHPGHEQALTQFGVLWLFMLAVQMALARWQHAFGVRQLTGYVGTPVVVKLIPIPHGFARRVLTPLYVFAIGCLIDDRALSMLIRSSAIGQAVLFAFIATRRAVEDDAASDASLMAGGRLR